MIFCECPMCDETINLRGYKENDVIECPECGAELEIVSLHPPVVEEPFRDEDEWEEDGWNDDDDDDDDVWNDRDDGDWDR